MAVWIVRVLDGGDPEPVDSSRFADVDSDIWYAAHVERMFELEVTEGCGNGANYCPDRPVKRSQMAVFLTRAFDLPQGPDPGFSDVPIDIWYADHVAALAESGITKGCGDGTMFCPDGITTRGQMATFLHRAINRDTAAGQPSTRVCDFSDRSDAVRDAVFQVHTVDGIGTAFYIGNDEWLTAAHVVEGYSGVTLRNGDTKLFATVLGSDAKADMALLKASAEGVRPLSFSEVDDMKAGAALFAVGYPLYVASEPSVARGVLSRMEEDPSLGTLIVTDASLNPGNSGGPLVDACGDVMGMIVAKQVAANVEGIGYAIAETTLQQRIPALQTGGSQSGSTQRTYEECFGTSEGDPEWSTEVGGSGDWDWATATKSATGDQLAVAVLAASSYEITDHDDALPEGCDYAPDIIIACSTDTASYHRMWASIWWSGLPVTADDNDVVSVSYGFDDGSLQAASWQLNNAEDGSILVDDEAAGFLNKVRTSRSLSFVGWDNRGREAIRAEFRLVGAASAIGHLWDVCGWEELAPPATSNQPAGPSNWQTFDGESLDGRYVSAQTQVDISDSNWQQQLLFLAVRCTNNSVLEIYFGLTSAYIFGDNGYIEYRFGNQTSPIGVYGNPSASGTAVFLHDVDTFIADLRSDTSGHLALGIWDYTDYTYIDDTYNYQGGGQLSVLGADEDVEPVLTACGY